MSNDKTNAPRFIDMGLIAKDFPRAYDLVTNVEFKTGERRDLFDRFDEVGVFVTIDNEHHWGYRIFIKDESGIEAQGVLYNSDDGFQSRHQAEVAAFTDAFKCVEENIK